jgi:hypothetical protein
VRNCSTELSSCMRCIKDRQFPTPELGGVQKVHVLVARCTLAKWATASLPRFLDTHQTVGLSAAVTELCTGSRGPAPWHASIKKQLKQDNVHYFNGEVKYRLCKAWFHFVPSVLPLCHCRQVVVKLHSCKPTQWTQNTLLCLLSYSCD